MDVGIDLTRISRFENRKESFIKHILTQEEYENYLSTDDKIKAVFLATHWASKEAIFKATQDQHYLDYTILKEKSGKPYIKDHEELKLSITHEDDYVCAIVIKEK